MNHRLISEVLIIGTIVCIIIIDVWLAIAGGGGATFSEVIRDWSYTATVLPYGFGVLMGHWFINKKELRPKKERLAMMYFTWGTIVVVGVLNIFFTYNALDVAIFLGVGTIVGALFWPLKAR